MKFKYLILILLCVVYIFTTTGCEAQQSAYNGSVKGVIVDNSVTKPSNFTAQPVVKNIQTYYSISLTKPGDDYTLDIDSNTFDVPKLEIGNYELEVNAYKSAQRKPADLIASCTQSLVVDTNPSNNQEIFLNEIAKGQGNLCLSVLIPNTSKGEDIIDEIKLDSDSDSYNSLIDEVSITSSSLVTIDEIEYKEFKTTINDIDKGEYKFDIRYLSNGKLITHREAEANIFVNLDSILNVKEETDLSSLEVIVKVLDKYHADCERDGSLGNEYLETDVFVVKSNLTNIDYKIKYRLTGEIESDWLFSENKKAFIEIPNPDSNGQVKIEALVIRDNKTSDTVILDDLYFKTIVPEIENIKNTESKPHKYLDYVNVDNFDSNEYDYKYEFGTLANTSWDDLEFELDCEDIQLNTLGPLNIKAKNGNFLESDLVTEEYKIQLPEISSAKYLEKSDSLVIDYKHDVLDGAKLTYMSGVDAAVTLPYNEDKIYLLPDLEIKPDHPLVLVYSKEGWIDSKPFSVKGLTNFSISNNNPSYYTGKAYYNGEEVDDSVVKNYIISSAATFDFDVLNNVGDVVAIEDSKINVFINNVVHKTTDNKLIKSINSLNDSKVYVKIDTPNYGKQIWYLTIQKDRRVEEDFDVTFTF